MVALRAYVRIGDRLLEMEEEASCHCAVLCCAVVRCAVCVCSNSEQQEQQEQVK